MMKERKMISPTEAAKIYGLNTGSLANLRSQRRGPKFYKVGRKILYDTKDLETWLKRQPVLTVDSVDDER